MIGTTPGSGQSHAAIGDRSVGDEHRWRMTCSMRMPRRISQSIMAAWLMIVSPKSPAAAPSRWLNRLGTSMVCVAIGIGSQFYS